MLVGVPRETIPGERRVAMTPGQLPALAKGGLTVLIETGAGEAAGFPDAEFSAKGAQIAAARDELARADILACIRTPGTSPHPAPGDLQLLRAGQTVVGLCDPLGNPRAIEHLAARGVDVFSLEMVPRITRAQSMDVLSSMATVSGYRAVLEGAMLLPKMFPLMMTAAGTLAAARVLILGAGVAGLNAIATARRLGAVVQAYDVRPAVKEQVESLGAKFVELPLEMAAAEDRGGYAKTLAEETYRRQRELIADVAAGCDLVITTAAVPGKRSPLLVTREAVERMAPGSVVVDLAAERGGNCELTRPDETVRHGGVTIIGPTNLPADCPRDASLMFSKNMATFLAHIVEGGQVRAEADDEIIREALLTRGGQVVHPRIRELLAENAAE